MAPLPRRKNNSVASIWSNVTISTRPLSGRAKFQRPNMARLRFARLWRYRVPKALGIEVEQAIEQTYRRERGQVLATLMGTFGDLELAEDALQEAMLAAVEVWPEAGLPTRPGAWLTTTARRKAIDRLRRAKASICLQKSWSRCRLPPWSLPMPMPRSARSPMNGSNSSSPAAIPPYP